MGKLDALLVYCQHGGVLHSNYEGLVGVVGNQIGAVGDDRVNIIEWCTQAFC